MTLERRPGQWTVCRIDAGAPIPDWAARSSHEFLSITRTDRELSIVAPDELVPTDVTAERGWRLIRVVGPLDFNLIGILSRLTGALAEAGVPVFAVSTYDTDYLLVKRADESRAVKVLRAVATVIGGDA